MSIFSKNKLADLKKQIQEAWKKTPHGWETHVQNVYVSYYQLRQNKLNKGDRSQHWRQYLDQ